MITPLVRIIVSVLNGGFRMIDREKKIIMDKKIIMEKKIIMKAVLMENRGMINRMEVYKNQKIKTAKAAKSRKKSLRTKICKMVKKGVVIIKVRKTGKKISKRNLDLMQTSIRDRLDVR